MIEMELDKEKGINIIFMIGYFLLIYLCMQVFNIGEYDWMLEPGDSICSLPTDPDDLKDITAPLSLFLFGLPLLIALIRDIIIKDIFRVTLFSFGLIVLVIYWWWSFWGQYAACAGTA